MKIEGVIDGVPWRRTRGLARLVAIGALTLPAAACMPKDDRDITEATAASAYVQECSMIGATSVHVVGKVLGISKYTFLIMTVRVHDQTVPGVVRGERKLNLEYVEDGFLGNTDIQVGEDPIEPVCTVADVTGPGGQPL